MSNPPSPSPAADAVTVASVPSALITPSIDPTLPPPRKFPAPCWTQDETMALINAYKDKWYALRCRNLRSADWDAVASDLFSRCPPSVIPTPGGGESATTATAVAKTSAQCRHKMEKLRKRYRTEKQRALAHPNRFFASSWIFFDLMDSMETGSCSNGGSGPNLGNQKGFALKAAAAKKDVSEERGYDLGKLDSKFKQSLTGSEDNQLMDLSAPIKFKFKNHGSSLGFEDASRFDRHLDAEEEQRYGGYESRSSGFFDRKIGGRSDEGGYYDSRYDPRVPNGLAGFSKKNNRMNKRPGGMMMEEDHQDLPNPDPNVVVSEMVRSIRMLGEGFVKMEKMKVDMVRDIERMRMEMEMKRSEMILESQQLIVNAFVEGLLGSRKKSKNVKLVD